MSTCKGCGIQLQSEYPDQPGYTPKKDSEYCQRCFRLIHYDDLTVSMRTGIDSDEVLKEAENTPGAVLWVVDLFDFEAGMIPGLNRKLPGKDIFLVCTKRDLLPETVSTTSLSHFIYRRLKELNIRVKGIFVTAESDREGADELRMILQETFGSTDLIVIGRANAGKSTLLNRLNHSKTLTSSRYPGTTLAFNRLQIGEQTFIDTPGLENGRSILLNVDEKTLKQIIPAGSVKPRIYQIYEDQCFTVGGLVQLYVLKGRQTSVVFYMSDALKIHRTKAEKGQEMFDKHYGELFVPVPLRKAFRTQEVHIEDKTDIVVDGLGWVCISGDARMVRVKAPENVNVTFRKAMF